MRSQTWCFNRGIARDLLRRGALVWAGYFALLLITLPAALMSRVHSPYDPDLYFNRAALAAVQPTAVFTVCAVLLSVIAAFAWMYNSRSCNLMASLPVSRPSLFLTSVSVSLGMCLAALVLTALITLALAVPAGQVQAWAVGKWLEMSVFVCIGFYGFALFCAMLTGNLIVLPVIFVLLGCAAVVAEFCLRHLMSYFIFGLPVEAEQFAVLSPLYELMAGIHVQSVYDEQLNMNLPDVYTISGVGLMAVYCACGVVLTALALLLFRRRAMERAGDTVAFDVLRPIFRVCMTLGCAVVLPSAVFDALFNQTLFGAAAAAVLAAMACAGAFVGWYGAEMIMRKSTAVFFFGWKRLALLCAAILVFFAAGESDLFGFERRIPAPEDVEAVSFQGEMKLEEEENIRAVCALHESIVSHKERHEHARYGSYVVFRYTLRDGRELSRSYRLALTRDELLDPDSDLNRVNALLNTREAVYARTLAHFPLDELLITNGYIEYEAEDRYESLALSGEQAEALLREAVLPDLDAGCIGRDGFYYPNVEYYTRGSGVRLYFSAVSAAYADHDRQYSLYLSVQTDSAKTVPYLKEHFGIEVIPNGLLNPPGEYDLLYGVELDYGA